MQQPGSRTCFLTMNSIWLQQGNPLVPPLLFTHHINKQTRVSALCLCLGNTYTALLKLKQCQNSGPLSFRTCPPFQVKLGNKIKGRDSTIPGFLKHQETCFVPLPMFFAAQFETVRFFSFFLVLWWGEVVVCLRHPLSLLWIHKIKNPFSQKSMIIHRMRVTAPDELISHGSR